jgi:hypothetical protein
MKHDFTDLIEELTTLSATELDALVADNDLTKLVAETRLAGAVAVVEARGSFREDGYRSIRSCLMGTPNCSGAQANRIRRLRADLGAAGQATQT